MTGELALAVGVGLAIVVCGALAWWGAIKSFSRSGSDGDGRDRRQ
jgi:hypothetical protein